MNTLSTPAGQRNARDESRAGGLPGYTPSHAVAGRGGGDLRFTIYDLRAVGLVVLLSAFQLFSFSAFGQNVTNLPALTVPTNGMMTYVWPQDGGTNHYRISLSNLFNPPSITVTGASSGFTNYALQFNGGSRHHFSLSSLSNVHLYAVLGSQSGVAVPWTASLTNLSGDTWGFNVSAGTNRFHFSGPDGETNAPTVLTNNTLLRLEGVSEGTNTWVKWRYYRPAL